MNLQWTGWADFAQPRWRPVYFEQASTRELRKAFAAARRVVRKVCIETFGALLDAHKELEVGAHCDLLARLLPESRWRPVIISPAAHGHGAH